MHKQTAYGSGQSFAPYAARLSVALRRPSMHTFLTLPQTFAELAQDLRRCCDLSFRGEQGELRHGKALIRRISQKPIQRTHHVAQMKRHRR